MGHGNVFTSVCLSTGGRGVCLSACWDTPPDQAPPGSRPPSLDQAPPQEQTLPREQTASPTPPPPESRHPPGADTPLPRPGTPREQTPLTRHPPGPGTPPWEADCSIRLTNGRYASYWNAFLLTVFVPCSFDICSYVFFTMVWISRNLTVDSTILLESLIRNQGSEEFHLVAHVNLTSCVLNLTSRKIIYFTSHGVNSGQTSKPWDFMQSCCAVCGRLVYVIHTWCKRADDVVRTCRLQAKCCPKSRSCVIRTLSAHRLHVVYTSSARDFSPRNISS